MKTTLLCIASLVSAYISPLASAADAVIGLNFCDASSSSHISSGTADGFSGWTDSRAVGDSTNAAVQTSPLALGSSGVTATWSASNTWYGGAQSNTEQSLYRVYLDDGGSGVRVTISGLAAWLSANNKASYQVRCYVASDYAASFRPISVRSGASASGPILYTQTPPVLGNGNFPTPVTLPSGAGFARGYVDFPDTLTQDIITLTIPARSGTQRGSLAAFKITAPALPPTATSLPATDVTDMEATLNGTANGFGENTAVSFEYGTTTAYGSTVAATPATLAGTTDTPVSATLVNLSSNTIYHYRVIATNTVATRYGTDLTFTTGNAAFLSDLAVSAGTLTPAFSKTVTSYSVEVPYSTGSIRITPVAEDAGSTIQVQGVTVASGTASDPITLTPGNNSITTSVTGPGASFAKNYVLSVIRVPQTYTFDSATSVPVTANGFVATGKTATFTLNFAPPTGTSLMVVKNTGLAFIEGTFDNLAQGQTVNLIYGGITYPFVATYFGGTGNDLVLRWGNTRLMAWGDNSQGQLGNNTTTNGLVPAPTSTSGILAGRTVIAETGGNAFSLALCSDGTLAAWGDNTYGQLGDGTTTNRKEPVAVQSLGGLAGRRVVAVAAGEHHALALCLDGTLMAWGSNEYGQLGGFGGALSTVPVMVDASGVLAGKQVSSISTCGSHNLALCTDGNVVAWGANYRGQLGNNTTVNATTPIPVDLVNVFGTARVVAVAAGGGHSLALSADGRLAAWGRNDMGQLGINSLVDARSPVLVGNVGALAGRTPKFIAAGYWHSLALCSDGSIGSWGLNDKGQLGNNSSANSPLPVPVSQSGVLAGRMIIALSAGWKNCAVLCGDGTLATFGANDFGQLGNSSTNPSSVPVLVSTNSLRTGERFDMGSRGFTVSHMLAIVASPPAAMTVTQAARDIRDAGATLVADVNPNGSSTSVAFEYGLTNTYGNTIPAVPALVSGIKNTTHVAVVTGLPPGTTWHYRVVAESNGGRVAGEDRVFTTTSEAILTGLVVNNGQLSPDFTPANFNYTLALPNSITAITMTPTAAGPGTSLLVNGQPVNSGNASGSIALAEGNNDIRVVVTSASGLNTANYRVLLVRLPLTLRFDSPVAGVAVPYLQATGSDLGFELAFQPVPGTRLTAVDNTGYAPIEGTFNQLAQGQLVSLKHGGITYRFVVDYFGGDGNDLVLLWANTRVFAWGNNTAGQLGDGTNVQRPIPVPTDASGVLAGKTVTMVRAGTSNSAALCSDGTVATWGYNANGQLGDGVTSTSSNAPRPVNVDRSGVLAGKKVVSIAAGSTHFLALCSDGTLCSWGNNANGQLGNNKTISSNKPVAVDQTGVLAGKRVIAVAAGVGHSLVLCSDGSLIAWGDNPYGQLGNNSTVRSLVPVAVDQSGFLAGRRVRAISTTADHNLVLCTDGSLASWGANGSGRLGNNSSTASAVPVEVDASGPLAGRTVVAISAGASQNLVLCSDGTLVSWGNNSNGALGDGSGSSASAVPVLVDQSQLLAGKSVVAINAENLHNHVVCSDGTAAAWGMNIAGELGDNTTGPTNHPVAVNSSNLAPVERFMLTGIGGNGYFSNSIVASPADRQVGTLAATAIRGDGATLNAAVLANGIQVNLLFEYGLTSAYGSNRVASPSSASGMNPEPASCQISGLKPGTTYHYRVVGSSAGGIYQGGDLTFTTLSDNAMLANLTHDGGDIAPVFEKPQPDYLATVPFNTDHITVTPTTDHPGASVRIADSTVASGSASGRIELAVGNNLIPIFVTAEDGITTKTYQITVTRLPQDFIFNSATDVPVTANGFSAGDYPVGILLNYAPSPGTVLTMVKNTNLDFIHGVFGNLAQGQRITLNFGGTNYHFVVNYFGGSGNDLVLQWADTQLFAWGSNSYGQLGDQSTTQRLIPTPTNNTGVLAGKTITAISNGYLHSLALCSDGTLATWGYNVFGQLGNNSTTPSNEPLAVDQTGILSGKTVIAISAGPFHNLALCSDGSIAAWGYNNYGQLGTGNKLTSQVPVRVDPLGALAGKQVIAVAAASYYSLALCSDGTLAAWGYNDEGELGDGTTTTRLVPVSVVTSGALAGKKIASISAGQYHTLALCTDGTLVAWGYNNRGQLGNNSTLTSKVPVAIGTYGALSGKTVIATRASGSHSLALCADGTLAAWGSNTKGQLGQATITESHVPAIIDQSGITAGKAITQIATGSAHSIALCSDGTSVAWGDNANGQLGNNSTTSSSAPTYVDTASLASGSRIMMETSGSAALHNLAIVALPPALSTNTGIATDEDSDHDGISNLIEYAFGLNPNENSAGQLPQGGRIGNSYVIQFTQPAGVSGITYGAECSTTMAAGTWINIPDTGTAPEHIFSVPLTTERKFFMRLKVTSSP